MSAPGHPGDLRNRYPDAHRRHGLWSEQLAMPNRKTRAGKSILQANPTPETANGSESRLMRLAHGALSAVNQTATKLGEQATDFHVRLFNPATVDRLQPILTRYRE